MSRYIDIDDISLRKTISVGGLSAKALWRRIQQEPRIDIVFCKDCHWARPRSLPGETGYRCVLHRIWKGENGFCDSGEREGE